MKRQDRDEDLDDAEARVLAVLESEDSLQVIGFLTEVLRAVVMVLGEIRPGDARRPCALS